MDARTSGDDTGRCFVIVSGARTGSSLLARMLGSHPEIRCHGELLGTRGVTGYLEPDPSRRDVPGRVDLLRERQRGSLEFYRRMMFETDHRRVGAKILYEQLFHVGSAVIAEWLTSHHEIDVIHLQRRDGLARYVSDLHKRRAYVTQYRMERARRAVRRAPLGPLGRRIDQALERRTHRESRRPVPVDLAAVVEDVECQHQVAARTDEWFAGHRILHVDYEQLVADPDGEWSRMVTFLGVDPQRFDQRYRPRMTGELSEMVANWTDIATDERLRMLRGA